LLTLSAPLGILLIIISIAGLGTSGTQTLIYGFVANYYRTNVRGAGVASCAGFHDFLHVGGAGAGGFGPDAAGAGRPPSAGAAVHDHRAHSGGGPVRGARPYNVIWRLSDV
jgi:hypothetical protein